MAKVKDHYDVLGVSRKATKKEIDGAFRKLARKYHPDVNPGDKEAEARFKEITNAHEVLSDPEKRKLYDQFGDGYQGFAQGQGPRPGANVRYQQVDPEAFRDLFRDSDLGGLGDLFGGIFGGRGNRSNRARTAAEPDVEVRAPITLQEAYGGTTRTLEVPDGRRIELKIPAGVTTGTVLRVPGVRARVEVADDPVFERDGKDLRVTATVPVRTALLGGEVDVPTLKGTKVKLQVPPQTQNGTRLRLRGLGMPDAKSGAPGDLYAEIKVRLPLPMDEATKSWAEGLPGT
jgi:DnaJ-class molecular chaperone